MNFEISAENYLRLASITQHVPERVFETSNEETIAAIKCVRLEYKAGKYYAIASNRKIAAIYYLGETKEPDSVIHLASDASLAAQCEMEKSFNSVLTVVSVPELKMATVKTLLGYSFPGNAGVFIDNTPLNLWPRWIPRKGIAASKDAMHWTLQDLEMLNKASPSGRIVFPEFIDANEPVIVRDHANPNWMGVFMANLADEKGKVQTAKPATVPEWWAAR